MFYFLYWIYCECIVVHVFFCTLRDTCTVVWWSTGIQIVLFCIQNMLEKYIYPLSLSRILPVPYPLQSPSIRYRPPAILSTLWTEWYDRTSTHISYSIISSNEFVYLVTALNVELAAFWRDEGGVSCNNNLKHMTVRGRDVDSPKLFYFGILGSKFLGKSSSYFCAAI